KNNPLRASAIGVPVNRRLIAIYTVAAFYAGIAGALFTQTTALASLDVFAFERSADLMLVLVIGGTGYLYGGLIGAVVFLRVEQGARHALIGPNGAGKTTVINLLTGVLKSNAGTILLEGNDITDLPVHTRVLRGLSRTFQINQLYADLTPLETVGLAVSERLGRGGDWWRRMGTRSDVNQEIAETLDRFHLLDVMNRSEE